MIFNNSLSLVHMFHLNSNYAPDWQRHHGIARNERQFKQYSACTKRVPLETAPPSTELDELLQSRRSVRTFATTPVSLASISALAGTLLERRSVAREEGNIGFALPSAGGLYPLELYFVTSKTKGLVEGLYHLDMVENQLEFIKSCSITDLDRFWFDQPWIANSTLLVMLTGVFHRTVEKYGARGYRFVLMEAGMAAAHLYLKASQLDLGSTLIGGFHDCGLDSFLGIEGSGESTLLVVAFGRSVENEGTAKPERH